MSDQKFTLDEVITILDRASAASANGNHSATHKLLVRGVCAEILEAREVQEAPEGEVEVVKRLRLHCILRSADILTVDRSDYSASRHQNATRFVVDGNLVILSREDEAILRDFLRPNS